MATAAFPDTKPWPAAQLAHTGIGSNSNAVPLEERIAADFLEGLADDGITARIDKLVERAATVTACDTDDMAGRIGDFVKLAAAAAKAVDAEREKHNRPLLTAQRTLKAKADGLVAPLTDATNRLRGKLDRFMTEQRRIAEERRREAEAQARAAAEAAAREAAAALERAGGAAADKVAEPLVEIAPVMIAEPVVRGDYGARVGTSKVWQHELQSVRQLPDRILKHARVVEAIDKVIAAEVRGGAREIKGVRIFETDKTVVR